MCSLCATRRFEVLNGVSMSESQLLDGSRGVSILSSYKVRCILIGKGYQGLPCCAVELSTLSCQARQDKCSESWKSDLCVRLKSVLYKNWAMIRSLRCCNCFIEPYLALHAPQGNVWVVLLRRIASVWIHCVALRVTSYWNATHVSLSCIVQPNQSVSLEIVIAMDSSFMARQ